jgi:hypothetical protein
MVTARRRQSFICVGHCHRKRERRGREEREERGVGESLQRTQKLVHFLREAKRKKLKFSGSACEPILARLNFGGADAADAESKIGETFF